MLGDSISWINNDPTIYTVTEGKTDNKSPKEFNSRMLGSNETFKHTFMKECLTIIVLCIHL